MLTIDEKSRTFFNLLFRKRRRQNVTVDDLIVFTSQLHALFKAGFTLSSAVSVLIEQTENEKMLDALLGMRIVLEKGGSLSKAIEEYQDVFPGYYVKNIYAAEMSGVLQATLARLLRYLQSQKEIRQRFSRYFLYPKIVLSMIIAGSIILAFVQEMIPLRFGTAIIGMGIFVALFLARDLVKIAFSKGAAKKIWDLLRLNIWIFGPVYRDYLNGRFAELFNSLQNAGVSIADVFYLSADTFANRMYAMEIRAIGSRLERHMRIADAIAPCPYFPFQFKSIFHIGEQSGEFEENLMAFARQKDLDIAYNLKKIFEISYIVILFMLIALIMIMNSYFGIL